MRTEVLARKKAYQKTFKKYGATPKAMQWKNAESAEIRYRNITTDVNFENKSVIDLGCGMGDIIPFIEDKSKNFSYTGVDVVPEFTAIAQKKYPQHSFLVGDWMELIDEHDIVLCSGVLNNKTFGDQYKYKEKAISLMYKNVREVLAFNMAGGFPQPKNEDKYKVYYVDSQKILKYCFGLTNKIILKHHYRTKDFTILMFRR